MDENVEIRKAGARKRMERMTEAKQATESERTAETGRVAEMKKAVDEARTYK